MCPTLCPGLSFLCPTWFCTSLSFLWLAQNDSAHESACSAGKTDLVVLHVSAIPEQMHNLVVVRGLACTEITCFFIMLMILHVLQAKPFWCPACSAIPEQIHKSCLLWLAQKWQDLILLMLSACSAGKTTFSF